MLHPHPFFRLFATSNTIGLGDPTGLYHGTQPINQGQMDRWNIVTTLNYLPEKQELDIVASKFADYAKGDKKKRAQQMVAMANLTRQGLMQGDISTVMSPRTVLTWVENTEIFGDVTKAFKVTFYNKCDEMERPVIAEYYQRCFDVELNPQKIPA